MKILPVLLSRTLFFWLLWAFVLYYLTAAVWSKEAFAGFVALLSTNVLFQSLYVLFVVNIAGRMIAGLRMHGRSKGRFFLRLPLYAGLLLFLLSFFLSLNVRENRWLLRGEGDPVDVPREQTAYRITAVHSALERRSLKTEGSLVFDYEPAVELMDRQGARHEIKAFPPRKVGSSWMHVLNFGIGPGVELRKKGEVMFREYVALRLTPFGTVDQFTIEPWPYTFYLSILPNRMITRGRESGREYDLARPLYRVEIVKGDRMIAQAESGAELAFDGDMTVRFFEPSDWVVLEVVYNPFYGWFVGALVLLCAGLVLFPVSYLLPGGGRTA